MRTTAKVALLKSQYFGRVVRVCVCVCEVRDCTGGHCGAQIKGPRRQRLDDIKQWTGEEYLQVIAEECGN